MHNVKNLPLVYDIKLGTLQKVKNRIYTWHGSPNSDISVQLENVPTLESFNQLKLSLRPECHRYIQSNCKELGCDSRIEPP